MVTIADPQPRDCKICGGPSPLFGVVDFHKSCIEAQGKYARLSGKPVYYRRCAACDFLFTDQFDEWSVEAFRDYIYNGEYALVDPEYSEFRPTENAKTIEQAFSASRGSVSLLDYGGGNGLFASLLRERGFRAISYEPISEFSARPTGRFDLITCFEVMEHVPHPERTVADMTELLADDGLILFSTLTQPVDIGEVGLQWWYVAPRNGHISLYSRRSLAILFERHGLQIVSLSDLAHVAFRKVPAFAAHLLQSAPAGTQSTAVRALDSSC